MLITSKSPYLVVFFSVVLCCSVLAAEHEVNKPRYGGTLRWGTRNSPTLINPLFTTSSVSMSLLDLIFNRLVRLNPEGEIEPDLAKSWDISEDRFVYTFHLRKGVLFHDGVECTASDVEFTYRALIDPAVASPYRPLFEKIKALKMVDKYTFQIFLKEPDGSLLSILVREILPEHILREEKDLHKSMFNRKPVGTGPFKFSDWNADNVITLEYNPDYYEGRPFLDRIVVKTYPSSRVLWSALMRQEVDYATFIEREDYEVLRKDKAFKTYAFPADFYYALAYNMNDRILKDKRVRQAIAYAVDLKGIIDKAAFGYGLKCLGPFHPLIPGFSSSVKGFAYDPEKARELLREAGWRQQDKNGILERGGRKLEILVLVDSRNEIYRRIIMELRQQLQIVGIMLKVKLFNDDDALTPEFLSKYRPQAQLRLVWGGDAAIASSYWAGKWGERFGRLWSSSNNELNDLIRGSNRVLDFEERKLIFEELHSCIYQNQPACFLYFPFDFHAVSARFQGTESFFNLYMPAYKIKDWSLSS